MRSLRAALAVCAVSLPACGESAAADQERPVNQLAIDAAVDSLVSGEALRRGVPGLAVVIVSRGRVVLQRAYGTRNVDSRLPVTLATPFNVASLTKSLTALAALRLVADGRLRLDARARSYLPSLPQRYDAVTMRQLLTHTSGVARDLRRDNLDDPSVEEYRRRLDSAAASGAPGTRWEYSNTGYTIVGWVIEAITGEPLARALEKTVFGPLDMRQAGYRAPLEGDAERAAPHSVVEGRARLTKYVSGGFGSGGALLSGADLASFAVALQTGRALSDSQLAWAPARLGNGQPVRLRMFSDSASYGMGWFITVFAGERLLTHGGAIEGFSSNLYHFPNAHLTIAVVANAKARDDGSAPVDPLAQALARYCLSHAACSPAVSDAQRIDEDSLRSANRQFSLAYLAGDTARMRAAYTPDAVALPPSGRIVSGPSAIAILFAPPPSARRHLTHALYTERRHITGDVAHEAGTWYDVWEQSGDTVKSSGRYVLTWRRTREGWLMTSDSWWGAPRM